MNDWDPCRPGTISKAPSRETALSHRRKFLLKIAAGAVLGAGGISAYVDSRDLKPKTFEDLISCQEVALYLPQYVAATLGDRDLSRKIRLHLTACAHCEGLYEQQINAIRSITGPGRLKSLLAAARRT